MARGASQQHTTWLRRVSATAAGLLGAILLLLGTLGAGALAQASTPDTEPPVSSASSPAATDSVSIRVEYTASDGAGSGLAGVELWVQPPGAPGYSRFETDTSSSMSGYFQYSAAHGDGAYRFYTIATDRDGNSEPAPAEADAATLVEAVPEQRNGKIVFSSNRAGGDDIYTMNADGTDVTRLTTIGGRNPAWSPDGQKIVFESNGVLWVMNADGSEQTSLGQEGFEPAWSPGGTKIVFWRKGRVGRIAQSEAENLYTIKPDGTELTQITFHSYCGCGYVFPRSPTWAPDSSRIAYVSEVCDNQAGCDGGAIRTIPSAGGSATTLVGSGGFLFQLATTSTPDWSPDGAKVAYGRAENDDFDPPSSGIHTIYADGTGKRAPLTEDPADVGPVWSPDGTKVAFSRGSELHVVNADGTEETSFGEAGVSPDWQPLPEQPLDPDRDGVSNEGDNCAEDPNPGQADADADGEGDACDSNRLTQLSGTAGCTSETGSGGQCAGGRGLDGASSVAVSPDGKNVYVASRLSDAVARFNRNTTTGALSQPTGTAGCISETGSGGQCADGRGLDGAFSVVVSADGRSVYVASQVSDAVARFNRNTTTGALSQPTGTAGCTSETGSGGQCADGRGLDGTSSVVVSADGRSVYVASQVSDAVARFNRNTTTGALSQPTGTAGCTSETGSGGQCADGKALDGAISLAVRANSVYVASRMSDAVARFNRNATTGALVQPAGTAGCTSETDSGGQCVDGRALDDPSSVAISRDGKSVYVASQVSDALVRFNRNATTGALVQPAGTAGCVSETGTGGDCAFGEALNHASSVRVSADGMSGYVASQLSDAVAAFTRNTTDGGLSQSRSWTAACISETGSTGACADGRGLDGASSVVVSADGKSVYAASQVSDAVAILARGT